MNSFTFSKKEKLCSQKIIGELFASGDSFLTYPLKLIWKKSAQFLIPFPAQAVFSVPKRNFKKSHDRNCLKRRMRESYRFHKNNLYESLSDREEKIALMIIYIGKEKLQYKEINSAMAKAINRLKERL